MIQPETRISHLEAQRANDIKQVIVLLASSTHQETWDVVAAEHERLSHAQMVAAAEKARIRDWSPCLDCPACEDGDIDLCDDKCEVIGAFERNGEVEVLLAILRLHKPTDHRPGSWCGECSAVATLRPWPCPTVQLVADRLTGWGAE